MGEPQVILFLGHMVGEFVAERETDPDRLTFGIDDVDAGDLRLLPAVERKGRAHQIALGRNEDGAVALVEPFGLSACGAPRWLAAFEPKLEHPHGVR